MPRRQGAYQRTIEAGEVEPAKAAETVAATSPAVSTDSADGQVLIEATANVVQGVAGTAVVCRIRRGTLTGAVVGKPLTYQLAAGLNGGIAMQVLDAPGEVAGQTYVLTVEATAATGNPKVQGATISVTY